ncbi:MAG TPA: right-handed parallel beta-helix repeat-containing protein, partial [Chitinophaga sp.]|uniref:right-handed parallel beta-helix repeat-containing protein n=1 Tax=Chitinophaga sp. TaxID=1869181 RepID=UPI002C18ACBE
YGDDFDNKDTESAEGYVGTIKRALAFGWNKGTIGGHIIRNNTIAYCEQAGIVGSMGCSFSTIQHNTIHDIHIRRLFNGAEMAGIKFHGAVDVRILDNHIYNTNMGIWLDWMAQGVQVMNNLLRDNTLDIFLEVNHGPILVGNNLSLSKTSLSMNSSGVAFVHNIFAGKIDVINYDSRLTPYHKPHSTSITALHDNPGGDIRFVNNLFVRGGKAGQYSRSLLPVAFNGNVYTNGTVMATKMKTEKRYGEMNTLAKKQMEKYSETDAVEQNAVTDTTFDTNLNLIKKGNSFFLEVGMKREWLKTKRQLATTKTLGKTVIPGLPFENPDGSDIRMDIDYTGKKRNTGNPSPGPFEIDGSGKHVYKVW